jgi:glycosyltransferase involved in cell wall biosynthesis
MKISIIGQVYPFKGGISHYNSLLANELMMRAEVQVISFKRIFPKWLHPLKSNKDTKSKNFFKGEAEFLFDVPNPLTWSAVIKRVVKYNPDVLIMHWYTPILAVPFWFVLRGIKKRAPQCKIVVVCHNVIPHEKTPVDTRLTRFVLRKADVLITHSKRDVQNLKNISPQFNVLKLFHPVYDFFYTSVEQSVAQKNLGVTGNIALFFGGIRNYKGLDYLLHAIPKVVKEVDMKLVIAGEFFGSGDEYKQLIKKLGIEKYIILFDRYITNEEVRDFFSASDVVIAPYISGTQSGALNIAIAFEKPVIATDVGGLSEIIIHRKSGVIVPPKNSDALADAVIKFFKEKPDFTKGIKQVKQSISWETYVNKLIEELQK